MPMIAGRDHACCKVIVRAFVLGWLLAILVSLSCGPCSAQSSTDDKIEFYIQEAQRAQSSGNLRLAIQNYTQVLSLKHNFPEIETNLGLLLYLDGNYPEAAKHFRSALNEKSDLLSAKLFLGMALVKLGEHERAIAPLRAALEQDSSNADVHLALCNAYSGSETPERGVKECLTAARLSPENPEAWYDLGNSALETAKGLVDTWALKRPDSPYIYILKGESYREQEKYGQAILEYGKVLRLSRNAPEGAYLAFGELHLLLGDLEGAQRQFAHIAKDSEALQYAWGMAQVALAEREYHEFSSQVKEIQLINPEFLRDPPWFVTPSLPPQALAAVQKDLQTGSSQEKLSDVARMFLQTTLRRASEGLALAVPTAQDEGTGAAVPVIAPSRRGPGLLMRDWRFNECTTSFQSLNEDPRADPRALAELAACEWSLGEFERAWQTSSKALRVNPRQEEALYWKIKALLQISKSAFARLSRLPAGSGRVHELLGKAYEARGQDAKAAEEYRLATEQTPGNAEASLSLAELHLRKLRYEEAIEAFKKALTYSTSNPDAHYGLGVAYVQIHQPESAIEHLQKALGVLPKWSAAHIALGQAYRQLGRYDDAIAEFEKGISSDKDGALHYQLYQMYRKVGSQQKADLALKHSVELREKSRESRENSLRQQLGLTKNP